MWQRKPNDLTMMRYYQCSFYASSLTNLVRLEMRAAQIPVHGERAVAFRSLLQQRRVGDVLKAVGDNVGVRVAPHERAEFHDCEEGGAILLGCVNTMVEHGEEWRAQLSTWFREDTATDFIWW